MRKRSSSPRLLVGIVLATISLIIGPSAFELVGIIPPIEAQQSSVCSVRLDQSVVEATFVWEKEARVEVTKEARGLVAARFSEKEKYLCGVFARQELDEEGQARLGNWLVGHYMYEVRDRKMGTVTVEGIQEFPVSDFLLEMDPLLQGDVGRLEVISNPDQARITIDDKKQGSTCKNFVLSTGEHTVTVVSEEDNLECRGTVNVPADETVHFRCPDNSECPECPNG